jgi:hypothetical protein
LLAAGRVPQDGCPVIRPGEGNVAVAAEGDALDRVLVPAEGLEDLTAVGQPRIAVASALSTDPVRMRLPSALSARLQTPVLCPGRISILLPLAESQTTAALSGVDGTDEPVTTCLPSGLTAAPER